MSSFSLNDTINGSRTPLKNISGNAKRRVPAKSPASSISAAALNLAPLSPDSPYEATDLSQLLAGTKPIANVPNAPNFVSSEVRKDILIKDTTISKFGANALNSEKSVVGLPSSSAISAMHKISSAADSLLQAKIDHLERERTDLSNQLHQRDEKERSRKLKLERLEKTVAEMTASKIDTDAKLAALQMERDVLVQKLSNIDQSNAMAAAASTATSGLGGTSFAATLANELANPPAYFSAGDPATQGLWYKMTAASKELRRMEEEAKCMASARDDALHTLEAYSKEVDEHRQRAERDRLEMAVLKEAAAEADAYRRDIDELTEDNNNFKILLEAETAMKEQLQRDISQGRKLLESLREGQRRLEEDVQASLNREQTALGEVQRLAAELDTVQAQLNHKKEDLDTVDSAAAIAAYVAGGGDAQLIALAEDLRVRLRESEAARRKIHSELQDLKGNVRVLVRVRPFLSSDGECRETHVTCLKDETSLSITQPNKPASMFHFDHCFGEKSTQDGVYKEVTELIQSSMDGYRVCIFSYGQTGSGKTWTMSGERTGSQRGIIPRAVQQIIEQAIAMKKQGWTVNVGVSVLELYNEDIRDLIVAKGEPTPQDKLKISNVQGRVSVAGLTVKDIDTSNLVVGMSHLEQILDQANRTRTTISTSMNDVSSRSHMIFMLEITGVHADGVTVTRGGLRLVDLAGSERLDRTGTLNDAARLKETVNINKSLSSLADVFVNLGQKSQHIPYRNSKLTMLLQDCLSGTGKSLMIVNVSPTQASTGETLCSLRFADQVSQVELGKAQKQMYVQAPVATGSSLTSSTAAASNATAGVAQASAKSTVVRSNSSSAAAQASRGKRSAASAGIDEVSFEKEGTSTPAQAPVATATGGAIVQTSNAVGTGLNSSIPECESSQMQPNKRSRTSAFGFERNSTGKGLWKK